MSDARTNTQKLVTLHVDHALFEAVEEARGRVNRSQFIRDAIAEKCVKEGIPVPKDAVFAPDRARKGGPKWSPETLRKTTEPVPLPPHMLNDGNGSGNGQQKPTTYPAQKNKNPSTNK